MIVLQVANNVFTDISPNEVFVDTNTFKYLHSLKNSLFTVTFSSISILPNVTISVPVLIYMFYNAPPFLVKSAFSNLLLKIYYSSFYFHSY